MSLVFINPLCPLALRTNNAITLWNVLSTALESNCQCTYVDTMINRSITITKTNCSINDEIILRKHIFVRMYFNDKTHNSS